MSSHVPTIVLVSTAAALAAVAHSEAHTAASPSVRDALWVWANPEMANEDPHDLASYAQAGATERASLLGAPNILMAGNGLPRNDDDALALAAEVAHAPRLVWEIGCDDETGGPPFAYDETVARVAGVVEKCPQLEGVLLDDMTSQMIPRGLEPPHLRSLKSLLGKACPQVKLWGVVYTMNLGFPNIEDYLRELDVINLWVWHARDFAQVDQHIQWLKGLFPEKPIVLGVYLYDYGEGRPMPIPLLEQQLATALRLLHEGTIRDIVFLTINNDEQVLTHTATWIADIASQPIGQPPGSDAAPTPASAPSAQAHDTRLALDDPANWHFTGSPWTQDPEGVIRPPDARNLHSRAFRLGDSFGDLDAEFEFNGNYRETGTGTAGLILRAQDVNRFYLVHFPWGGQQLRAKHFWALVSKADGDGYLRNLAAEWVPGVPSETDRWYHIRVVAAGPEIRVSVDGREALCVRDGSYPSGLLGFAGYGWYAFRNASASGEAAAAPFWDPSGQVPTQAFTIGLSSEQMPSACIAPNGHVLVAAGNQLVRSTDKGRSWNSPENLPEALGIVTDYGNGLFCASEDRVSVMLFKSRKDTGAPLPEIAIAESNDNGTTWSAPAPSGVADGWPEIPASLTPYGPVTPTADGALLRFLLGTAKDEVATFSDVRTWSATHCKAYVIRSVDGGRNWSTPIEIDRPSWTDTARGAIPGSLDLTEPTAVVMGTMVMALVRPIYSPYMWQCWSYDGGATWDAASRATFPGYAQSMARTSSGAILCAHRYPLYSVNVSRDNGLNWDAGTIIDFPVWAMGVVLEVEPDVLLCAYMNAERNQPLLAQRVRITPTRIEPASSR